MTGWSGISRPHVAVLWGLFHPGEPPPDHGLVPGHDVPEPYRSLLVHQHYMTVTVEAHHGCLVDVRVLAARRDGDFYSRLILLTRQSDGRVVQLGIPRIDLSQCSSAVRDEILAQKKPLGRILIEHNVLRRIEPTAYFRMAADGELARLFELEQPRTTYGRLGILYCDGRPAIEVLEVVTPE